MVTVNEQQNRPELSVLSRHIRVRNRRRAGNIRRAGKFAKKNRHNTGKYL